jgi:Ca2+-binding EF-hand superfamily protein
MTLPKFLKLLLEEIKEMEKYRLELSRNNEIVILELFKLFDYNETGAIDKINFYKTLKKFGLNLIENEINLIFREFDNDNDGCLE